MSVLIVGRQRRGPRVSSFWSDIIGLALHTYVLYHNEMGLCFGSNLGCCVTGMVGTFGERVARRGGAGCCSTLEARGFVLLVRLGG